MTDIEEKRRKNAEAQRRWYNAHREEARARKRERDKNKTEEQRQKEKEYQAAYYQRRKAKQ